MNDDSHTPSPCPLLSLSPPLLVSSPTRPIVIIGGGFAGLAAAVDLAEAGRRVLLLERRSFLGGRAYSFKDKITGDTIDNGQHLMMGCYHNTLRFLKKIGAHDKLKIQANPRVDFLYESSNGAVRCASFKCPPLPAPLHLLGGLANLKTIGWNDRIKALRVGLELFRLKLDRLKLDRLKLDRLKLDRLNGNRAGLADITVRQWLDRLGQPERIQRRFWDVVALATLNESPDVASADMFARVLDQAFLHAKRDSALIISKVGLSDLYTEDARRFIESRGGEVMLNADVAQIEFAGDGVNRASGVVLRNGRRIEAEEIVSAVPHSALGRMLAKEIVSAKQCFHHLDRFGSAPIVSINLWFERPVADLEFAGLLDSPIEWVFNKNAIAGQPVGRRQHLALVISGAHEAAMKTKEELIEMASGEMARFFPAARRQRPVHAFVVREQEATISHSAGTARLRPPQRTDVSNLFLAGDWTDTGLPATIEGAVWSGQECARALLSGS
jgi:squalene-associated FAD-dependent desaturase